MSTSVIADPGTFIFCLSVIAFFGKLLRHRALKKKKKKRRLSHFRISPTSFNREGFLGHKTLNPSGVYRLVFHRQKIKISMRT